MPAIDIPTSPAALTAEWLTTALRRSQNAPTLSVNSFTSAPLDDNKGFYGQLIRLHLQYSANSPNIPSTLIAKFSSANAEMRQRSIDSYQREVNFYQQLAHNAEVPTPHCYYAAIDPSSGAHLLLLQDLAPAHSASRLAGCTIAQAQIAIHHIAKLHTHWWGRVESANLAWLPDTRGHQDSQALRQQYDQWWPLFYQQAQPQLPAEIVQSSQALGNHRAFLRQHIFNTDPRTLIHRDYQLDNLIFGAQGQTNAFAIIDWQFLSRGRGVWDIAYFLSENLLPEDRRQAEMALLTAYHQTLLGQGVADYPFEQCLRDYRLCLLQRHTALVSTIAAMPFSAEQRHIHINILLPRNIAALVDHNAFALLL